jgi:excisionase family DNA binding protein
MTSEEVYAAFQRLSNEDKTFVLNVIAYLQSGNEKEWMTVREAALQLGVSPNTIHRMAKEGSIRAKNIAERKTMVAVEDIDSIAEGKKQEE